jgi:hypothetical protein
MAGGWLGGWGGGEGGGASQAPGGVGCFIHHRSGIASAIHVLSQRSGCAYAFVSPRRVPGDIRQTASVPHPALDLGSGALSPLTVDLAVVGGIRSAPGLSLSDRKRLRAAHRTRKEG